MEGDDYFSGSDKEDICLTDTAEIEGVFKSPFYLEHEEAVSLKKNYIIHMSAVSTESEARIAVGLSSYETLIYSIGNTLSCTYTLPAENSPIVNIRFVPENPSLVYVGCSKGLIKLWDLRSTNNYVQLFRDTSDPKLKNLHEKTFSSFDVNCAGRFLCAGTEVVDGDAFLMFWDTRKASLLGGYWECHEDDVTQVSFHPNEADKLITGSTDGLINIYDISERDENEALLEVLNTESSVEKLQWHEGSDTTISCITHTADVQLWHSGDNSPYNTFSRASTAACLQMGKEQFEDNLYVADVHSTAQSDQLLVLAGSNFGNGRCLRSATTCSGKLSPYANFDGNKQIVRCSWFDSKNLMLVTGGETGILSVWKSGNADSTTSSSQHKATSKLKEKPHKTKTKPY